MNSSPFLRPSEMLANFSDQWLDRSQCNPSYHLGSSVESSKVHCASDLPGLEHQPLDHLATWQFPSRSSMNVQGSFDDLRENSFPPLADVPDLSHTPYSCDSSASGSTSLPCGSSSDQGFACYAPDMDALDSKAFDPSMSSCHPPEFSIPSFPYPDSTDMESTIHSPKPVFAYRTFDFDFDRPHSPNGTVELSRSGHVGMSHHKRHRDDESGFEDIMSPKRRKMSGEAPGFLSLFPDPYRDVPTSGWDPCSPVDTSYENKVFSMEQLLHCSFEWGDKTWPKLPAC